jgi:hypothetical protein
MRRLSTHTYTLPHHGWRSQYKFETSAREGQRSYRVHVIAGEEKRRGCTTEVTKQKLPLAVVMSFTKKMVFVALGYAQLLKLVGVFATLEYATIKSVLSYALSVV